MRLTHNLLAAHPHRAFDKPRIQPSHTVAQWRHADARFALQEPGQERPADIERGPWHVAGVLAGRVRGAVRGHSQVGHRERHQCVRHI